MNTRLRPISAWFVFLFIVVAFALFIQIPASFAAFGDEMKENDKGPGDPASYTLLLKALPYYNGLVDKETAAIKVERAISSKSKKASKSEALLRAHKAVERAHYKMYIAHSHISDLYEALNLAEKLKLAEAIRKVPLSSLGIGAGPAVLITEGRTALENFILEAFMNPDYISAFSLTDDEQKAISREVRDELEKFGRLRLEE